MRGTMIRILSRLLLGRAGCGRGAAGVLGRLRRDRAGNTLAIVAASIFPIAGIIGSGLDMGRAYLVQTRLQQACDAGVLAGRRKMGAGGQLDTPVRQEIVKFTEFNFPQRSMDTSTYTVNPTMTASTETIDLSLSTNMDTTIMRVLGVNFVPVSVACSARDDYMNVDIMLVLDTTGSMACKPQWTENECKDYTKDHGDRTLTLSNGRTVKYIEEKIENSANVSRMEGLRAALSSLRTQMAKIEEQFATAGADTRKRIRWAIVPFSQMTNPGLSIGPAGTTLYSRNPNWFNTTGSYRRSYNCGRNNICADAAVTETHLSGSPGSTADWMSKTWDGCVEERGTVNTVTPSSTYQIPNNIPTAAYDLNIDLPPTTTTPATRWTVADPSKTGNAQYACPKAMREWNTMSVADFNNYFKFTEGFAANGGTHLDIGMLWAARMMSRTGMWRTDNPEAYNGFPVARYIIFMTDGQMEIGPAGYGSYAQERFWQRVTTDGAPGPLTEHPNSADNNHYARLRMICTAIKNMDTKIYAISFGAGSTLTADMQACSSGAGYGFKADDSAALNTVFGKIADNIGSLRLSQ